jgi:TrmH family RNA methyltransferase
MITSTSNARVKHIRSLQARRRARDKSGSFVVEGFRLAQEALDHRIPVEFALYDERLGDRERGIINNLARSGAEIEAASERVIAACSLLEEPPKLILVLPIPQIEPPPSRNLVLILDGISDPGNLGTILRTAAAAEVDGVYLTEQTVDPYNPKVVRGGMGAHFQLPIQHLPKTNPADALQGLQIVQAEARTGRPYFQMDWQDPVALVVGSESKGVRDEIAQLTEAAVYIPMPGGFESLNVGVATAVILFEILRQRGSA